MFLYSEFITLIINQIILEILFRLYNMTYRICTSIFGIYNKSDYLLARSGKFSNATLQSIGLHVETSMQNIKHSIYINYLKLCLLPFNNS